MARTPVPTHWFNVNAAIPELYEPYVDPETNDPVTDQALEELFAPELVAQEVNRADTWLPIPEEVLRRLSTWRPTPLLRARGL
ncbi:MAG: TrpB-like pyridoxal-phosphate dependent enzyme, partial [Actinomycetia bacterium]|nr:TrpB-like pyridoxal-phosphate dependent enzyme [Actinomycetes bacterium]